MLVNDHNHHRVPTTTTLFNYHKLRRTELQVLEIKQETDAFTKQHPPQSPPIRLPRLSAQADQNTPVLTAPPS